MRENQVLVNKAMRNCDIPFDRRIEILDELTRLEYEAIKFLVINKTRNAYKSSFDLLKHQETMFGNMPTTNVVSCASDQKRVSDRILTDLGAFIHTTNT